MFPGMTQYPFYCWSIELWGSVLLYGTGLFFFWAVNYTSSK